MLHDSNLRTTYKHDNLPPTDIKTHRKNEYSLASPIRQSENKQSNHLSKYKFRSPLRQQEYEEYNRIKSELKKSIETAKENISLNQSVDNLISIDEYHVLENQHKYQIQRLLMEIEKLHGNMYEIERNKNLEIVKLKQEYEKMAFLNMSNVRHTCTTEKDELEAQLRKVRQNLESKVSEYENLMKKHQRQVKNLTNQNNRLNDQIKNIIQKKNQQILSIQRQSQQKSQKIINDNDKLITSIRESFSKQIKSLQNHLSSNESKLEQINLLKQSIQTERLNMQLQLQSEKQRSHQQMGMILEGEKDRYQDQRRFLDENFMRLYEELQRQYRMREDFYENELERYKKVIRVKSQDRDKLIILHNEKVAFLINQKKYLENENNELKELIRKIKQEQIQQTEIMKVKMSGLHQHGIKLLVQSYQGKIQTLISQLKDSESQTNRLRKNLYDETNNRYEMRKRYAIEVSKLNAKVIKLRSGLSAMQVDMKEKIENERSVMMMTSRSIIKDVQSKAMNNKFHQEQVRKLRQLFDLQEKEIEQTNNQVEEKIRIAEEELGRLSKKIIDEKNSHQQTEMEYKQIVKRKDSQIQTLKKQLNDTKLPEFDNSREIQLIEDLKNELHERNVEVDKLKDELNFANKKINLMKSQIQKYEMESQITQQQAKIQYQRISNQNMEQFKKFYENRLAELQKDKQDMRQLLLSKEDKIISLVKKYQELEKMMNETVNKIKKRTELESKVIKMGLDNNLVKNMVEITKFQVKRQEE